MRIDETARILHPTDFSRGSEVDFAHALKLALAARAELEILHVDRHHEQVPWIAFPFGDARQRGFQRRPFEVVSKGALIDGANEPMTPRRMLRNALSRTGLSRNQVCTLIPGLA